METQLDRIKKAENIIEGINHLRNLKFKTQKWYDNNSDKIIELMAILEYSYSDIIDLV